MRLIPFTTHNLFKVNKRGKKNEDRRNEEEAREVGKNDRAPQNRTQNVMMAKTTQKQITHRCDGMAL